MAFNKYLSLIHLDNVLSLLHKILDRDHYFLLHRGHYRHRKTYSSKANSAYCPYSLN
jgi:hypothetical protein